MAKPSKKSKVTKTTKNSSEPEKQSTDTSFHAPEATADELPLEEHNVSIDHMDVDPAITMPPNPIKPPSPMKPTEEKADDVTITRYVLMSLSTNEEEVEGYI